MADCGGASLAAQTKVSHHKERAAASRMARVTEFIALSLLRNKDPVLLMPNNIR
jgi:hypothetical protein